LRLKQPKLPKSDLPELNVSSEYVDKVKDKFAITALSPVNASNSNIGTSTTKNVDINSNIISSQKANTLKPQMKKRYSSQSDLFEKYEYFHPGKWTIFDYESHNVWSCCLNYKIESKVN